MAGTVLDENHGIDVITQDGIITYQPWYRKGGTSYYYTSGKGWKRVILPEYHRTYNHIAHSRRMRPLTRYGKLASS